jgi:hypothetical protein
MIKKEYIQPKVKEIKVNLPVVLAAGSPSENLNQDEEIIEDDDIACVDMKLNDRNAIS